MNTQKQDRMQGNKQQNQSSNKPGQQNQQGQKTEQQGGGKNTDPHRHSDSQR